MTDSTKEALLTEVAAYYSNKLSQFGQTARGVDWNGEDSQKLRFAQLCKIINPREDFSICDVGCGYGALYEFLSNAYETFSYTGIDVSADMVQAAMERFERAKHAKFVVASGTTHCSDYSVASGIFNVRLERSDAEWRTYIEETLDILDKSSRKGFSFNCLTSYSDKEKMRDYLYYADPLWAFDFCKRRYSRNVALLHDYDLYEFTILVRK
jgi:SAM-dependent methyltransferase